MSDQKNTPALKFLQVYEAEQAEIAKRRAKQFYLSEDQSISQRNCVGLALSGGGIRSATFCLGFLQELNRLKLLRIFDYLSTVSGGGYVGGWWSAWLSRDEKAIRSTGDPLLERRNIHNASSFVARIAEGDGISDDLRKQIRLQDNRTYRLLTKYNDGEEPSEELLKKLIEQLNLYIKTSGETEGEKARLLELSAAPPEGEAKLTPEQSLELKELLRQEKERQWNNRFKLEEAFTYELRNNFPPDELIEPVRRLKDKEESDGSLHAYRDPVHHLRLFANYLTPRKGMLSADTWRAVSTIIRNLILTWLILLPVLITVMLLGQAYLLLNPWTRRAFEIAGEQPGLISTMAPLAVLIGLSIVIAIGWLICNRETAWGTDWLVQGVCLLTLLGLLASGIFSAQWPRTAISQLNKVHWILLGTWAGLTAIIVIVICFWGLNTKIGVDDPNTLARWRKEVRRSRFSRAQSRLLVTTTVVAIVLFVSWLCTFPRPSTPYNNLRIAILPILSVAGSIFTALRARPTAASDRSPLREPTFLSRVVFAVTPPMVLVVLAAGGGIVANRLLKAIVVSSIYGHPHGQSEIPILLYVSGMLFIALCVALAVFEMKEVEWFRIMEPSVSSAVFIGIGMVTGSWFIQAMLYSRLAVGWERRLLFWISIAVAVVITVFVLVRVFRSQNWKAKLLGQLENAKKNNSSGTKRVDPLIERLKRSLTGSALSLISFLAMIGLWVGQTIYVRTSGSGGKTFPGIILSLVGIFGGVIVYRLFLERKPSKSGFYFEVRWMRDGTFRKRPESRWILAALCLIIPVGFICLGHTLVPKHECDAQDKLYLWFPFGLLLLTAVLIVLRSRVIQKLAIKKPAKNSTHAQTATKNLPPKASQDFLQKASVLQTLAICALLIPIVAEPVSHTISSAKFSSIFGVPNAILMGALLLLSFPTFGAAIFRLEPNPQLDVSSTSKPWNWMPSQFVLWLFAFFSIVIAIALGVLLQSWLVHISEIPLDASLIPILLPGAVGCFLLVLVEMYWGEGENRRGLWLISLAYIGFASILFFSLESESRPVLYAEIVLGLLAAVIVWVVALGWMVDPNALSMHQFYRGRLVRAYLGASNVRRNRHGKTEITETVAGDDLVLNALHNCDRGGPYHIINTTLNLVGGRDLATAQRSASSFTLSQDHCGSGRTDYRPAKQYMSGLLSLGTAVAASGAAVSPNMGSKKPTAALAMLMTLLNVRLGYWAPRPNGEAWESSQPRLWPFYLLREFLSQTNDVGTYCYLTDGGHFDNTGLYSLIERGCRYIILVDCGADPKPACFQDLGEAIRRCRIDFGTEIELSLDSLVGKKSDRCCIFGRIHFSPEHMLALGRQPGEQTEDSDGTTGTIIYVKPVVVPAVTADIRQYSLENNFFPQQTTANQWFDEAQFESYRRLGEFCANRIFDIEPVQRFAKVIRPSSEALQNIFKELEIAWGK